MRLLYFKEPILRILFSVVDSKVRTKMHDLAISYMRIFMSTECSLMIANASKLKGLATRDYGVMTPDVDDA